MAKAIIEFPQVGDLLLLILVGSILALIARITLLKEGRVVAGVGVEASFSDLVDGLDDLIHELPVVGNQQDGPRIGFQVVLQPEKGDEIEVIGGFVEQEQIGLHDEQSGQMGAHHPTAAQFLCLPLEVLLFVAKADEDFLRLRLDLRVAECCMLRGGFAVFGGIYRAGLLEFLEALFQRRDLSCPAGGDVEHGLLSGCLPLLGEMADHRPFIALDGPRVGFILLEKQREEGRFAGAIGTHEGDALPVVDLHVGLFEEGATSHGFLEFTDA